MSRLEAPGCAEMLIYDMQLDIIAFFVIDVRHLQKFWGASGDFWQAQWEKIVYRLGDDPATYWVQGEFDQVSELADYLFRGDFVVAIYC